MRKWFLVLTSRTIIISPCKRAWKTVPKNYVRVCVHFCLRPLEPLERCGLQSSLSGRFRLLFQKQFLLQKWVKWCSTNSARRLFARLILRVSTEKILLWREERWISYPWRIFLADLRGRPGPRLRTRNPQVRRRPWRAPRADGTPRSLQGQEGSVDHVRVRRDVREWAWVWKVKMITKKTILIVIIAL